MRPIIVLKTNDSFTTDFKCIAEKEELVRLRQNEEMVLNCLQQQSQGSGKIPVKNTIRGPLRSFLDDMSEEDDDSSTASEKSELKYELEEHIQHQTSTIDTEQPPKNAGRDEIDQRDEVTQWLEEPMFPVKETESALFFNYHAADGVGNGSSGYGANFSGIDKRDADNTLESGDTGLPPGMKVEKKTMQQTPDYSSVGAGRHSTEEPLTPFERHCNKHEFWNSKEKNTGRGCYSKRFAATASADKNVTNRIWSEDNDTLGDGDESENVQYEYYFISSSNDKRDSGRYRRVRFKDPIVTRVIVTPRLRSEDIERMFYTNEETIRFRQEWIYSKHATFENVVVDFVVAQAAKISKLVSSR